MTQPIEPSYQEVFESSPDAIVRCDESGQITMWNPAAERLFGYSATDVVGRQFTELVAADGQDRCRGLLADITSRTAGEIARESAEMNGLHQDGGIIPLEVALSAIKLERGWQLTAILRDATKRKHSASTLEKTAEILKMIATGKPVKDIYDAIALMYEARHPGMRCSMLELVGNKLMHGGAPSLPQEYCEAVNGLENGPEIGSCGTSTYTGERVLVEDIATDPKWAAIKEVALPHGMRSCWSEPIKNSSGEILGAFGMYYNHPALPDEEELRDLESAAMLAGIVMEREQREMSLRKSENKYRTLVETLPQRFFLKDTSSVFLSCSKNLAQDLGVTPDQIVGTTDGDYFPPEMAERFRRDDQRVMESGVTEEIEETILIAGQEKVIHTVKAPALDEAGDTTGVLGIFWEVTEQKRMEEQLLQSQKMEAVGTLVGGIAHDFNNILTAILGQVFLAKLQLKSDSPVTEKLTSIDQLGKRAADMVQHLLTFARKDSIESKPLSLNAFMEDGFRLSGSTIPENIEHSIELCREELVVNGSTTQLQQVLMNLLNNANDACVGVAQPRIESRLAPFTADGPFLQKHPDLRGERFACITIKDNGHGIAEDHLESIFEPFFTTKEVGEGTGLGLAMVYGAIQSHGGAIEVESSPGAGTSFHVYLPLAIERAKVGDHDEVDLDGGDGETILLVDDEPEVRATTRDVLVSLGYRVLTAVNGEEAVNVFREHRGDIKLAILDLVMPRMGGVEAAKRMREIEVDIPVIFVTGYDRKMALQGEDELERSIVLNKPLSYSDLSQSLRTLVSV